ncbi:hypothetical protein SAMD00019534_072260 [Acytostelium subglobosum LB1]|uniref:hypothetical protein n=1 Tax=Acytostelium subglobosum LB1 TaxID=1410327 RepID=UPI000644F410|nr:hypothetical protein SAMD00019534_072260 [Acytostelium subglobosum LB1]GAM24051.1 hypothetical protein SAMD00019534_072260 [Acytostelium subglobosum LB1]|eukprot:XP_012753087.1 hypothetical protein SAMD00019534_072260 [Acytostelium subglobosum LB1]
MFMCKGEADLPMPRIDVRDVADPLSFPVRQDQLQGMIEHATRAPYGKGTETITDLNVRRVWQIQNTDITITSNHFQTFMSGVISVIKESMALVNETVTAELYKLLVYDKGSFFLPHRDSEKADNMFGTLVLSLPCPQRGGDLVINHSGRDEVVSLENDSISTIKWTAFFADCQHEVKPVTEGNRVCLVYNLLRSGGKKLDISIASSSSIIQGFKQVFGGADAEMEMKDDHMDSEDDDEDDEDDVKIVKKSKTSTTTNITTKVDSDQSDDEDSDGDDGGGGVGDGEGEVDLIPKKLVYCLDHVYSIANFTLESLKSSDISLARTLLTLADECNIKLGLAFIHIKESGDCMDGELFGINKSSIILNDVKDLETGTILEQTMPLHHNEIMPSGCLDNIRPYSDETKEATGNEGGTYERQYRRSVIVAWSQAIMGKFTMIISTDVALKVMTTELAKLGGIDANPKATHDLFDQMFKSLNRVTITPDHVSKMLGLFQSIKNDQYLPKLLQYFFVYAGNQVTGSDAHLDVIQELLLKRPSMNKDDTMLMMMTGFMSLVTQDVAQTMMSRLLSYVTSSPEDTRLNDILPILANQLTRSLDTIEQCDKLINMVQHHSLFDDDRQEILDAISLVAGELLVPKMPKSDRSWPGRSVVAKPRKGQTLNTITNIERLAKLLSEGIAPIYVTDSILCNMYNQVLRIIDVQRDGTGLGEEELMASMPIMERIHTAHPEWIKNQHYTGVLQLLIDHKPIDQEGAHLYMIWRIMVQDGGRHLQLFVNKLCGGVTSSALLNLLKLLHANEFAAANSSTNTHYATLWVYLTKINITLAKTKPTGNQLCVIMPTCQCSNCKKMATFLSSQNTVQEFSFDTRDNRSHLESVASRYSLGQVYGRGRHPQPLTVKKTPANIAESLNRYNEAVIICHGLSPIRPEAAAAGPTGDILNEVINGTPMPIVANVDEEDEEEDDGDVEVIR